MYTLLEVRVSSILEAQKKRGLTNNLPGEILMCPMRRQLE